MGQTELEAALKRNADNKAREIWATVEAEAQCLRDTTAEQLQRQEQEQKTRLERQINALKVERWAEAERAGQRCRLEAEAALAERLLTLGGSIIEELAAAGGESLFAALAEEIPPYDWRLVRVNQRDQASAAKRFPAADINCVEDISAGLEVQDQQQRVQVINTLGKRLIHLWPELLPELMAELRKKAGDHGTAC